jgi:hypothetical protein
MNKRTESGVPVKPAEPSGPASGNSGPAANETPQPFPRPSGSEAGPPASPTPRPGQDQRRNRSI